MNTRALAKGTVKISAFVLVFSLFAVFLTNYVMPVFAATPSIIVVTPDVIAGGVDNQPFEVVVTAGEGHTVHEFRVYESADFSDLTCDAKPNWHGPYYGTTGSVNYCEWNAMDGYEIQPEESITFYFTMDSAISECCRDLRTEPRDLEGTWTTKINQVCIDATAPNTIKTFNGPQKITQTGIEWIDGITTVVLTPTDPEPHPSGVAETWYKIVQICGESQCENPATCTADYQVPTDPESAGWTRYIDPFQIPDECCHKIIFYSVDNVGNTEGIKANCFYVDKTAPSLKKEVSETNIIWGEIVEGADRLLETQNNDGTWEWSDPDLDKTNGAGACKSNVLGITAMGLLDAYRVTSDVTYLNAAKVSGDAKTACGYDKTNDKYYAQDIEFLAELGQVSGDSTYTNKAVEIMEYFMTDDNRYCPTDGCTAAELAAVYEGYYPNQDDSGLVEWQLASWVRASQVTGKTSWANNMISEINYDITTIPYFDITDTTQSYYALGLAGVVSATGNTGAIQSLLDSQDADGGWYSLNPEGPVQDTAYVVMALIDAGEIDAADAGALWIVYNQELNGGWIGNGDMENTEATSEAIQAIYAVDESEGAWITTETDITFTCKDQGVHPSEGEELCFNVKLDGDDITCGYCSSIGGSCATPGYCCVDASTPYTLSFNEDSNHVMEYYCRDAVKKQTDVFVQSYRVDTTAPTISKTMIGEYSGDCPPGEGDVCYVNGDGTNGVRVDVTDGGEICAVGGVMCAYKVEWNDIRIEYDDFGEEGVDILFDRDSEHTLTVTCSDELGNSITDVEVFLVDSEAPNTEKTYGDPTVFNGTHRWINSSTEITLTSTDNKIGVDYIKYRYCRDSSCYESCGDCDCGDCPSGWTTVSGDTAVFTIPQESEHCIEYYAVDKFGNKEDTKSQCVYVENTPPETTKIIGTPQEIVGDDIYISKQTPINLSCSDNGNHPVDDVSIFYRYRYADDCSDLENADWGVWIEEGSEYILHFSEDSCHELEYYCVDALGNEEVVESEIDIVDTQSPVITIDVVGPSEGECPTEEQGDVCYIDGVTEIHVDAYDPTPHPVEGVTCDWDYEVIGGVKTGQGQTDVVPPFDINFPEESKHILTITCQDKLGNENVSVETFYVDKTAPMTVAYYGIPYVQENGVYWINSYTPIFLTAYDVGPHKSGIYETNYRVTQVSDDNCWDSEVCQSAEGSEEDFVTYEGSFNIGQESCHLIEFYSVDNVDKDEDINKQCVFVDNTGPTPIKTVGEPKDVWTPGENGDPESYFYTEETENCWSGVDGEIECWEATTLTPILMECEDEGSHPVGENKVCFNVDVDGEDKTREYCEEYGGWYHINFYDEIYGGVCCRWLGPEDENDELDGWEFFNYGDQCDEVQDIECYSNRKLFYFLEETEHNLQYYCVDKLWNLGPVDDEKFKVEGNKFEVPLFKKWNLISVPFTLLDDNPETVFSKIFFDGEQIPYDEIGDYIDSVWTYDPEGTICGQDWCVWSPGDAPSNLRIKPGWGYWVLVTDKPEEECGGMFNCFWEDDNEDPLWMVIGGSLFSPSQTPPSRELQDGWNLIGYYGVDWENYEWSDFDFMCGEEYSWPDKYLYGDKVYCSLNSLIDTQEGYPRWSSLWSYVNCGNHNTDWLGLNSCIEESQYDLQDRMYAGRGYWIELDVEETYAPATTCIWNEGLQCV